MGIIIPLQRGIHIPSKNKRNNYSLSNEMGFSKNPLIFWVKYV
jgi:hypothetical protein